MKLRTCLVCCEESQYPFTVLEELDSGVLLALRPQDSSLIFSGDLSIEERIAMLENCLVGIDPREQRFLTFGQTKRALGEAKSLLLRLLA